MLIRSKSKGFSTVEMLLAASIFTVVAVTTATALRALINVSSQSTQITQATLLLEEGAEAIQQLRDEDWDTNIAALTVGIPYGLYWDSSAYVLGTTTTIINGGYRREVVFNELLRDGSGVLDETGTADTDSRRYTITIYRAADDTVLGSAEALVHNSYE